MHAPLVALGTPYLPCALVNVAPTTPPLPPQTALFVRVLRVAPPGFPAYEHQVFATISIDGIADSGFLAERVCTKLGWADAGQVAIFLVRDEETARAIQRDPSSAKDILLGDPLIASDPVVAGSWLLARVPSPPVVAPGAPRRQRAGVLTHVLAHSPTPYCPHFL